MADLSKMSRRLFGCALAPSALGLGFVNAVAQQQTELPWFDPEFARLPTPCEQVEGLAPKAVEV